MHKLIVQSATYRQSSVTRPEVQQRDAGNLLLARQSRVRLSGELVRDSALQVSGLLNPAIGGRSIKPPQPQGVAALGYSPVKWEDSPGMEKYRRGLYIHFQRTTPYPMLMNFDMPDSVTTCTRRQRSNTPLQALNLLNDPVFLEAAQALAIKLVRERPSDVTGRISRAFEFALGREATSREKDRLAGYYEQQRRIFEKDPRAAEAVFPAHLEGVPTVEGATWVAVARTVLNLDEFMTRE